jgi:hypothetical protein
VGSRALNRLFQVRTRRERQQLLEADTDLPLAEVDLDETSIESPSGQARELKRVEVECIHADPGALSPWVEQMRSAAQLQPVEASKFRTGLEVAGLTPFEPESLGSTEITPTQCFADAQLATLRRYFTAAFAKEAEARAGSVTSLHEMRVAAPRIDCCCAFRGYQPGQFNRVVSTRPLIKVPGAVRVSRWLFPRQPLAARLRQSRHSTRYARGSYRSSQKLGPACFRRWNRHPYRHLSNGAKQTRPDLAACA